MAGTEAVGTANTASLSEHRHQSLSALCGEVSQAAPCWNQDTLNTMLCAIMSPVSQLIIVVVIVDSSSK